MAYRLEDIQLEDLLWAAGLHRWLVALTTFAAGALMALVMANQPNLYRASARILIETDNPRYVQFLEAGRPGQWDRTFLQTEYVVISSRAVMSRVVEQLHLASFPPFSRSKDPIRLLQGQTRVEPLRGTKLVDIRLTGHKPELVARIANAVADTYVQLNAERQREFTAGGVEWLRDEVEKLEKKMREASLGLQEFREQHGTIDFGEERYNSILQGLQALNTSLSSTREERIEAETKYREKHPVLQELLAKERELQRTLLDQEQRALEMSRLSIQYNTLQREAKTSEGIYNILLTRLKELSVQEGLQSNNVQVVDYALVPDAPVGPPRRRRTFTAALLGFLLGCGLSFSLELFAKSIRTRQEFEQALGIPFLGHVPVLGKKLRRSEGLLLARNPKSPMADTIRSVRTTLEFILPNTTSHILLFTSAVPEEGKSLVCANLAVAFHELGRRVLLVDADLRRPNQHRLFRVGVEPGLSAYLEGHAEKEDLIQVSTVVEGGLPMVPSGLSPSQPTELLSSPRFRELLEQWRSQYQYILLDSPPVLVAADAAVLSGLVDAVVYLIRAQQTHAQTALAGKQRLVDIGAKIIGGILNRARLELERGYRYYYPYRYYHSKGDEQGPGRRREAAKTSPPASESPSQESPGEV